MWLRIISGDFAIVLTAAKMAFYFPGNIVTLPKRIFIANILCPILGRTHFMLFFREERFFICRALAARIVPYCLGLAFFVYAFPIFGESDAYNPFSQLQITQDGREVMYAPPQNDIMRFNNTQNIQYKTNSPLAKERSRLLQSQMLRGVSVTTSYLPGLGNRGLEMTRIRFGATLALPGIGENCYFLISPSFEPIFVDWDGPEPFPNTLYNASLSCTMIKQLNERWGAMLSVSPRWCSDGRETKGAIGCPIILGMTWQKTPRMQIRFGVAYLDRNDDYNILPYGGIIWQPNDDWKYELMVPQLRVMRRCHYFHSVLPAENDSVHWAYIGIGFGGGSWAFESVGKQADVADYTEYSIVLGFESEKKQRLSWKTEFGYVFGRKMEFDRHTMQKFKIDDSIVLRLTLSI